MCRSEARQNCRFAPRPRHHRLSPRPTPDSAITDSWSKQTSFRLVRTWYARSSMTITGRTFGTAYQTRSVNLTAARTVVRSRDGSLRLLGLQSHRSAAYAALVLRSEWGSCRRRDAHNLRLAARPLGRCGSFRWNETFPHRGQTTSAVRHQGLRKGRPARKVFPARPPMDGSNEPK
jgi:hypothetical protein